MQENTWFPVGQTVIEGHRKLLRLSSTVSHFTDVDVFKSRFEKKREDIVSLTCVSTCIICKAVASLLGSWVSSPPPEATLTHSRGSWWWVWVSPVDLWPSALWCPASSSLPTCWDAANSSGRLQNKYLKMSITGGKNKTLCPNKDVLLLFSRSINISEHLNDLILKMCLKIQLFSTLVICI